MKEKFPDRKANIQRLIELEPIENIMKNTGINTKTLEYLKSGATQNIGDKEINLLNLYYLSRHSGSARVTSSIKELARYTVVKFFMPSLNQEWYQVKLNNSLKEVYLNQIYLTADEAELDLLENY